MIHAGWNELKKAFCLHSGSGIQENSQSGYLLLFYAIESGLKAVYLRCNKLSSTRKIVDERIANTHDLFLLAKTLKLPAHLIGTRNNFRLRRDDTQHPFSDVHQAWRYHIILNPDDENYITQWLHNLKKWLEENI